MTEQTGYTPRGMYFEEFEVGYEVVSAARTITETDVVNFAALTGDWNQIHVNAEYAKETIFGQRVAHGLLGLSIASGLGAQLGFIEETVLAFRSLEWKFSAPIFIGDTIHLKAKVKEKKELKKLGGGSIIFDIRLLNQEGKTIQKGTWSVLVKSKA
ncbi:MAG TPA: dehydratase [Anaerolineae bacterium]|nr:dehydratase [Anaerolineae bacterium]